MSECPRPTSSRLHWWRRARPWLATIPALVWPLAYLFARVDWRADLIAHFVYPAAFVSLATALVLARRQRRLALALAVLAGVEAWPLLVLFGPNPVPPEPGTTARLKVLAANVLVDNDEHRRLLDLIRRERPDVIALVEVTPTWLAALGAIREAYPHGTALPLGSRGLLLWSRLPLERFSSEWPDPQGSPALWADLELAGRPLRLWVVHPLSPMHRVGQNGFPDLETLGLRIGRDGGARLVVGDLNTTDGSPHFADFLAVSGLRDGRRGFGPQPSWPSWSPLRITIDHSLVSPELAVTDRRVGADIGSDHRPILIEVASASRSEATSASRSSK